MKVIGKMIKWKEKEYVIIIDYKNDKMEGKGKYYWNDGDRYEGDYKNGLREGKGIMYYNNGKKEEGIWKNDKIEEN